MRWWDALHHAMCVWRAGRIDLTEADRLAAGGAPGPGQPGLGALLAAVTAPPSARELSGKQAAMEAFVAARRAGTPTRAALGTHRVRVPLRAGRAAVRIAVAVAVLTVGGTAAAAETGRLPAGLQQRAHDLFSPLGVPAPSTPTPPSGTDHGGAGGSGWPTAPSVPPTPRPAVPSGPAVLGLCQAWDAAQADPHGKAMTRQALRALAVAAGGDSAIAAFCADLVHSNAEPSSRTTPGRGADRPVPMPSQPGGGPSTPARPTPSPHRSAPDRGHPGTLGQGSGRDFDDGAATAHAAARP